MNEELIAGIKKNLKKNISKHRMTHTMGVAYTAAALAMKHSADMEEAFLAGLLHDCAKDMPEDKMLEFCLKYTEVTDSERQALYLLHGKAGALIAQQQYHMSEDVCNAIKYHTTGRADMTLLEKIIFVADYIEPNRRPLPNLEHLRKIAFEDIDRTVYEIARDTISYLKESGRFIDDTTMTTCNFYAGLTQNN